MMHEQRIILLKNKLNQLKQASYMQKVAAAEMLIEDAVFLLESVAADVEQLKRGQK